jgi:hypothetical protein
LTKHPSIHRRIFQESLEKKILDLDKDILGLKQKLEESHQLSLSVKSSPEKVLVWAEELFSQSEIAHIRRVFEKVLRESPSSSTEISVDLAARASMSRTLDSLIDFFTDHLDIPVNSIRLHKLADTFILKQDIHGYLVDKYGHGSKGISGDEFVMIYASLSGRRWKPSLEERRRLALQQLEDIASRVEIEAKESVFKQ